MAIAKTFNVDTQLATGIIIGSTNPGTEFVLMYGAVNAGTEFNISAIRVGLYAGSSAYFPTNGTITWRLRKVSGSLLPAGGSAGTATANPIGQSTNSALSSWYFTTLANATATFATQTGAVLWEQTTPCTAGANWGEWFTPGFELNLGAAGAGSLALTYAYGAAGTSVAVNAEVGLVISE